MPPFDYWLSILNATDASFNIKTDNKPSLQFLVTWLVPFGTNTLVQLRDGFGHL